MQELRLQSYHDFDGALFRNEAGWSVPAGYRSVDAKARVSDDVEFRDLGPAGHLEVLGPNADSTIGSVLGVEVRGISRNAFLTVTSGRYRSTHVGRVQSTGTTGYTIWSPDSSLSDEWEKFSRAGVSPIGRDALEL